ncbi:MAG TPA: PEGA domain-containing protein [candidate division WWE3 bacterium]|uniref:PEGA domain-containing protein n=1 Tax=candidate division WWE3 bacterium TaxID=2053526 RepID=A0A7C1DIA3_UNCKA|nr:PEGA domain-containing protein [candidate division WWE3 bacterium]
MTITIANQTENFFQKAKPWISYIILFAFLAGVAYAVSLGMHGLPGLKQKRGVSVVTTQPAEVYLKSNKLGETPLEIEELTSREKEIRIQSIENPELSYTTTMESAANTQFSASRDLGVSAFFSSGHEVWLTKDKTGLTVISQPSGATISIDGAEVGKAPFLQDTITEGEYDLKLSLPGYETQNIRIRIVKGYRLNVSAQLFPIPLPGNPRIFEESGGLWDLTLNNESIAASTERAKAVSYWMRTRPSAVAFGNEPGSSGAEAPVFEYYIDYRGNVYDIEGNAITSEEGVADLREKRVGAYLGFDTNTPGLTTEAKEVYTAIFTGVERATVLQTGTGWLRVRSTPSLSGEEIGKVNVGEVYSVLEKQTGWVKIKLTGDSMGWVSADFVKVE